METNFKSLKSVKPDGCRPECVTVAIDQGHPAKFYIYVVLAAVHHLFRHAGRIQDDPIRPHVGGMIKHGLEDARFFTCRAFATHKAMLNE
jgi:hypothetical protein